MKIKKQDEKTIQDEIKSDEIKIDEIVIEKQPDENEKNEKDKVIEKFESDLQSDRIELDNIQDEQKKRKYKKTGKYSKRKPKTTKIDSSTIKPLTEILNSKLNSINPGLALSEQEKDTFNNVMGNLLNKYIPTIVNEYNEETALLVFVLTYAGTRFNLLFGNGNNGAK